MNCGQILIGRPGLPFQADVMLSLSLVRNMLWVLTTEAISACRKGGTVSIPGVYGGWLDKFPLGAAFAKGLTLKMGQTHMHKYMPILLERIERGEIDPSFIITHRIGLEDASTMYRTFRDKDDSCIKVVMKPGAATPRHAEAPSSRAC